MIIGAFHPATSMEDRDGSINNITGGDGGVVAGITWQGEEVRASLRVSFNGVPENIVRTG